MKAFFWCDSTAFTFLAGKPRFNVDGSFWRPARKCVILRLIMTYMVEIDIQPLLVEGTEADILEAVRNHVLEHGIEIFAMPEASDEEVIQNEDDEDLDIAPILKWYPFRGLHSGSN